MKKNEIASLLANLLGVYDIDWDIDFMDDGYHDVLSLAPFNEPILQTIRSPIPVNPLYLEEAKNG